MPLKLLGKPNVFFEGIRTRVINNEGVLPPQVSPVGGRLSNFVEGWKRITNDPYVLSIVAKGYRLRFTSPPLLRQTPWEIRSPQDPQEILGMREQIFLMLQKNAIMEVPPDSPGFYSNVFLVKKASGGWRPVIDLKNLNAHIQDRSAGCVLPCTDSSKQQKVPQVPFEKQVVPVSSTTVRSKHSPSGFYSFGANGDSIPAPSGDLGDTISGRLVGSPLGPSSFVTTPGSAIKYTRPGRLHSESKEIGTGPDSGSPVPRNSLMFGPRESFTPRVQGLGDSCSRTPSILPQGTKLYSSVPASGVTQLGPRSYRSGSFVPETPSTSFSFVRSDRPVYGTASIRPPGPCQPTSAMAGPSFSYLRNPDLLFSGGPYDFYGSLQSGVGRPHGIFQDFGYLDPYRPQAPHQLSGVQSGYFCPTALGSSASGPPGYDRHGQLDNSFIYQQAGRDSLPHLATLSCRPFPLVRVSERNSPGKTHSRLSERDSRPPISSESANTDRVVPTPRDREPYLQGLGDTRSRHVCNTVELPPSSVHVSSSGVKSPSGGCSVSGLAGEVNVHVSPIPPAQQSHAETAVHSGGGGDSCSPLVAVSVVVSTSATSHTETFFLTVWIFCPSRIRSTSQTESRTICTYGGSHATLQSSRLFRRGL